MALEDECGTDVSSSCSSSDVRAKVVCSYSETLACFLPPLTPKQIQRIHFTWRKQDWWRLDWQRMAIPTKPDICDISLTPSAQQNPVYVQGRWLRLY